MKRDRENQLDSAYIAEGFQVHDDRRELQAVLAPRRLISRDVWLTWRLAI